MHQSVFLGWGFLVSLAGIIGLATYKNADYPKLVTAFVLALGGAVVGAYLLGTLLAGEPSLSSGGAILGGGFVIFITLHFFGPQPLDDALDIIVSSTFLGLLVTRAGCLGNQCDFGAPTDFFWAIQYKIGPIWQYHNALGINDGLQSHPVHPYPWMIIIPGAIVFAAVWAGNLSRKTEIIVYGYLVIRFFAEFFRDESTSISILGVQIGIVLSGFAFGISHHYFKKITR